MVNYDIEILRPVNSADLIRVGQKRDGGYVINSRVFSPTVVLIGLGINADWSFEEDFINRSQRAVRVYAYDFSVSGAHFRKEYISRVLYLFSIKFLLRMLKSPSSISSMIRINYRYAKDARKTSSQFPRFFDGDKNKFFQVGISNEKSGQFIRFDDVIRNLDAEPDPVSIFLKMDIEFSEYRIMEDVIKYADRISGLAIEFHELDVVWEQFCRIMTELKKDFVLTHIHGNNYGGYIPGTKIPVALEASFLNKKLVTGNPAPSTADYPIPGVDYPNDPSKADLPLVFTRL